MQHFALYLLLCGLTIASPGPGVLLTITNALQLRLRGALPGILGVVLGIYCWWPSWPALRSAPW